MYSVFQPPTAAQRAAIQRELDEIYADFTRQVGEARKLEGSRLDAAARGRVFTGIDAKQAGLIDELGGLQLALSIAKAKAGIDEVAAGRAARLPARVRPLAEGRRSRCCGWPASTPHGPTIRAPREVRDTLARFGIVGAPGQRPPAAAAAVVALTSARQLQRRVLSQAAPRWEISECTAGASTLSRKSMSGWTPRSES